MSVTEREEVPQTVQQLKFSDPDFFDVDVNPQDLVDVFRRVLNRSVEGAFVLFVTSGQYQGIHAAAHSKGMTEAFYGFLPAASAPQQHYVGSVKFSVQVEFPIGIYVSRYDGEMLIKFAQRSHGIVKMRFHKTMAVLSDDVTNYKLELLTDGGALGVSLALPSLTSLMSIPTINPDAFFMLLQLFKMDVIVSTQTYFMFMSAPDSLFDESERRIYKVTRPFWKDFDLITSKESFDIFDSIYVVGTGNEITLASTSRGNRVKFFTRSPALLVYKSPEVQREFVISSFNTKGLVEVINKVMTTDPTTTYVEVSHNSMILLQCHKIDGNGLDVGLNKYRYIVCAVYTHQVFDDDAEPDIIEDVSHVLDQMRSRDIEVEIDERNDEEE